MLRCSSDRPLGHSICAEQVDIQGLIAGDDAELRIESTTVLDILRRKRSRSAHRIDATERSLSFGYLRLT